MTIRPPVGARRTSGRAFGVPLSVYGHSNCIKIGQTPGEKWHARAKHELGLSFISNYGVGGFTAQDVANIMCGHVYAGTDVFWDARWYAYSGMMALATGGNELLSAEGPFVSGGAGPRLLSDRQRSALEENVRSILARTVCGVPDEIRAASGWTMTGAWTENTTSDGAFNRRWRFTQTQGDFAEKVLPAGDHFVFFQILEGAPGLPGGVLDISVGGQVVHTVDTDAKAWDTPTGKLTITSGWGCRRVTVPPGGAAVRVTKTDATTNFVVLEFTAPALAPNHPQAFLLVDPPFQALDPAPYAQYLDAVDAALASFTAEEVARVDLNGPAWDTGEWTTDGIHYTSRAEAFVAERFVEAIERSLTWRANVHNLTGMKWPGSTLDEEHNRSVKLTYLQLGRRVVMNAASPTTVSIAQNSNYEQPIGVEHEVYNQGAGLVTLSPDAGVTLVTPGAKTTLLQGESVVLRKRTTDGWQAKF